MTKHLKHAGAEVVEVASLSQAQELLRRPGSLDAIVADIVLPDGDSPDALRALEQERRVPVLYITSFPPDRFRSYGFAASDPQLLAKPFDQATLVKRLCALCA
jgi:DNA-binding response OmpR family regulator